MVWTRLDIENLGEQWQVFMERTYARTVKKQIEKQSDQTYTSNIQPNPISVGQVTPLVLKLFIQGRPPMIGWDDREIWAKRMTARKTITFLQVEKRKALVLLPRMAIPRSLGRLTCRRESLRTFPR